MKQFPLAACACDGYWQEDENSKLRRAPKRTEHPPKGENKERNEYEFNEQTVFETGQERSEGKRAGRSAGTHWLGARGDRGGSFHRGNGAGAGVRFRGRVGGRGV